MEDINCLNELRNLLKLESLILEGNPLVNLPNYKSIVISLLPNLKFLDSKVLIPSKKTYTIKKNLYKKMLTMSEKEICQKKLKLQYELLEKMLDNYCNLIQLQSVKI